MTRTSAAVTLAMLAGTLMSTTAAALAAPPSGVAPGTSQAFDLRPVMLPHGEVRARIRLDGHWLTISLLPHSVRAADFHAYIVESGELIEIETPPEYTYQGSILEIPDSLVGGTFMNGVLDICVRIEEDVWSVEHIAGRRHKATLLDEADLAGITCGVVHDDAGHIDGEPVDGGQEAGPCIRIATVACESDYEFYAMHGLDIPATIADMSGLLAMTNVIYAHDVRIMHMLAHAIVRTDPADHYDSTDPDTRLGEFAAEWDTFLTGVERDVAHLFTGVDLDGGVVGFARIASVCGPGAYSLSQSLFTGSLGLRVALLAHELGHNWSAGHCDDEPGCGIMCSTLGACSGSISAFGPDSVMQIDTFAGTRTCLSPGGGLGTPIPPTARLDRVQTMGGVLIDVLANDFDGNCQDIDISSHSATSAAGGLVMLAPGTGPGGRDQIGYMPPVGFTGEDSFTYAIEDSGGMLASTSVFISVFSLRDPDTTANPAPGLNARYFDLDSPIVIPPLLDSLPAIASEVVSEVDFPETAGVFAGSSLADDVGALFEGYLIAPVDGPYGLFVECNDGARILLGDDVVVENDGLHASMSEAGGFVGLRAGAHRIRIEFFEATGGAGLHFRWMTPGSLMPVVVPASALMYEVECPADLSGSSDPNDPGYGVPDGAADSSDFFFYLDQFVALNLAVADLSGSADPNDPAYGVPDGVIDAADFFYFLDLFVAGCP